MSIPIAIGVALVILTTGMTIGWKLAVRYGDVRCGTCVNCKSADKHMPCERQRP